MKLMAKERVIQLLHELEDEYGEPIWMAIEYLQNCTEWHPYAKVKPSEDKIYLVTYHYVDCNGKPTDETTYAEFKKGHFHNVPRVTAWAECPAPYRKENAE